MCIGIEYYIPDGEKEKKSFRQFSIGKVKAMVQVIEETTNINRIDILLEEIGQEIEIQRSLIAIDEMFKDVPF